MEGIESAMQLGEYLDGDLSQLREAMERLRRERLLGRWKSKTLVSAGVDATMLTEDWSPIIEHMAFSDYIPQFSSVAMTQRMEGTLVDDVSAQINLSAAVKNGQGNGVLRGILSKPVSETIRVRIEASMVGQRQLGVGLSHSLVQKLNLDYFVSCRFHGGSWVPNYQISLSRALGSSMLSSITVFGDADYHYGVSLGLGHNSETLPASISTQFSSEAMSLEAKVAHRIDQRNTVKVRFSSSSLVQISLGFVRHFDDESARKTSVMLEMGSHLGVALKVTFSITDLHFIVPIYISRELSSHSLLLGAALPSLVGLMLHNFVLQPYMRWRKQQSIEAKMQQSKDIMEQQRTEALTAIMLMEPFYERQRQREINLTGLVILSATYEPASPMGSPLDEHELREHPERSLDVTIPLQMLVQDSHLVVASGTKSKLLGFYNVAIGAPKILRIRYSFHGAAHTAIYQDTRPILLPLRSHLDP